MVIFPNLTTAYLIVQLIHRSLFLCSQICQTSDCVRPSKWFPDKCSRKQTAPGIAVKCLHELFNAIGYRLSPEPCIIPLNKALLYEQIAEGRGKKHTHTRRPKIIEIKREKTIQWKIPWSKYLFTTLLIFSAFTRRP